MTFTEVAIELGLDIREPGARPADTATGLHRPPVFVEKGAPLTFGPVGVAKVETPDG